MAQSETISNLSSAAAKVDLNESKALVLFDLPGEHKGRGTWTCFSPNVWRTRLVCNYKNIPYQTEWVEYPDIAPRLRSLNVPPHAPGGLGIEYTCPTIQFLEGSEKGKLVMDSLAIAKKLESLYPEPSLHLDADHNTRVYDLVGEIFGLLVPNALVAFVRDCLPPRSAEYFADDRKQRFGMSLEDFEKAKGGEGSWAKAEAAGGPLERLKEELSKNKKDAGPFILGSQVGYGDFVIVAFFETVLLLDLPFYVRMAGYHRSFAELHQACRQWLQRDD